MRALRLFMAGLSAGILSIACAKDSAGPKPLVAKFAATCHSLDCTFTDQSTVNDGTITSWQWSFGDNAAATVQNPTHTYTATQPDTLTATLTVTNNNGATDFVSKDITIAPPATLTCGGVDCDIVLDQARTVTVTLQSHSCMAHGDIFVITAPILDTLFVDGCYTAPQSFQLNGGSAFSAGTHLQAAVYSGSTSLGFTPTLRVTGAFPTWQLEFDDGEGCPQSDPSCGEPDFNDLIITIVANP